jgi:hypothetical protein
MRLPEIGKGLGRKRLGLKRGLVRLEITRFNWSTWRRDWLRHDLEMGRDGRIYLGLLHLYSN